MLSTQRKETKQPSNISSQKTILRPHLTWLICKNLVINHPSTHATQTHVSQRQRWCGFLAACTYHLHELLEGELVPVSGLDEQVVRAELVLDTAVYDAEPTLLGERHVVTDPATRGGRVRGSSMGKRWGRHQCKYTEHTSVNIQNTPV